jgi:hypothetical protein
MYHELEVEKRRETERPNDDAPVLILSADDPTTIFAIRGGINLANLCLSTFPDPDDAPQTVAFIERMNYALWVMQKWWVSKGLDE